jgi:hypothetical protein
MFGQIVLSRTREVESIATTAMVVTILEIISPFPGGCILFCSCSVYLAQKAGKAPFWMGLFGSITHVSSVLSLMVRSRHEGLEVQKPAIPVGEFIVLINGG